MITNKCMNSTSSSNTYLITPHTFATNSHIETLTLLSKLTSLTKSSPHNLLMSTSILRNSHSKNIFLLTVSISISSGSFVNLKNCNSLYMYISNLFILSLISSLPHKLIINLISLKRIFGTGLYPKKMKIKDEKLYLCSKSIPNN